MTEKEAEKIREDIKKYRSRLTGEKRRFGGYFDDGGVRYIIPELYLVLKDYKGALTYYRWFLREFPDDIGFPALDLFWTLILFKNEKISEAIRSVYKTAFSNTYLLNLVCNEETFSIDKSESDWSETYNYALETIRDCNKFLTKDFRTWLCKFRENEEFKSNLNRFVSLRKLLKDESEGPLRSQLQEELDKLQIKLTIHEDFH